MFPHLKNDFLLNPEITFLNFGSFGATVKPVFAAYQNFQLELEQEPVQFITVKGLNYLKQSREALANFIGCDALDVVYVTNPSYAVNIIAKSFQLTQGDEVLTTNLEYGACDKTWDYYCQKVGANYVKHPIKLPLTTSEELVEDFFKSVTSKTKLIFISHLTSSTGLRLPVEAICKKAKHLGILTFIDGAHAPGQLPLNINSLDVDMYTGACHKWMMTPKGSSFLYVRNSLQHLFDPLVVSWGYKALFPGESKFIDYHQGQGTRDFSAFLTIPAALKYRQENNWDKVALACGDLVKDYAPQFCSLLKAQPIAPLNDEFIAQLYSIKIKTTEPEKLKAYLYDAYKIEIPVMRHGNDVYIRYSINAFNSHTDLEKLYVALQEIIRKTNFIEV